MAPPLSICLISREYPPFFGGGIGSYVLRWSRVLAGAGHRVAVLTVSDDGQVRRERDGEVTVIRFPLVRGSDWSRPDPSMDDPWTHAAFSTFSPVSILSMQIARALPELCRELSFDVVEAPDTGALAWFALNARRTGTPGGGDGPAFITCIHSPTQWIARWNGAPLHSRQDLELAAMERDQARWSDGLVCPSRAMAGEACELWDLDHGRIAVVPYPLGELEQAAPAPKGHASDLVRLVYAGRMEPRKGVDVLIDAFASAARDDSRLELDLVGEDMPDGSGRFAARRVSSLSQEIRGRVRLHGRTPPERTAELQAAADVIAIPSPMDNFPNACVEAMARGRLVLAGRAGGMAEMIKDGESGLLFEPGSADDCARILRGAAALSPDQRAALGRNAAARVRELCGNERITAARIEHYRRCIAERRRPAAESDAPRRRVLFINASTASPEDLERLARPVADPAASIDFSHGWVRQHGGYLVFGTPTLESLAHVPMDLGPLAVAADALTADSRRLLTRSPDQRHCTAKSTWAVAAVLAAAGRRGAVLPEVRTDGRERRQSPPDPGVLKRLAAAEAELAAARDELSRIHRSHGWRLLRRVYAVLHVLRRGGRYHRPGPPSAATDARA